MEKIEINAKMKEGLLRAQQGELDAVVLYRALSGRAKNLETRKTLLAIAADEGRHASVFHALTNQNLKPAKKTARLILLFSYLLGMKRVLKLLSDKEYSADVAYRPLKDLPHVDSVMADETRHGKLLQNIVESGRF
ncbi:MAG TPA: rubrerythrin [Ruminococcaceae bacterium]|nr:rubrerythrin [Oscillospiraceae bacterium]